MSLKKKRYTVPDLLRGIAVLSMIVYHVLWDLVYIFDVPFPWFRSEGATVVQLGIRWAFLLISGFCWSFGKRALKRGAFVLLCSAVISGVTAIVTPKSLILFGVLTLIGLGMILTVPLHRWTKRVPPLLGLAVCTLLFILTANIRRGAIDIFGYPLVQLPTGLYANYFTACLGFPPTGFHSSDYVPLIPWIFLYWIGYYLYRIMERYNLLNHLSCISQKHLEWIGRHALIIYMVHQPLIYGILTVLFHFIE
ncbi:MAG: DUF1624 domain-containing protein [Clostridia bacterium]|nr:DUF1624 domain-containing protein [Clostridia bacterium]